MKPRMMGLLLAVLAHATPGWSQQTHPDAATRMRGDSIVVERVIAAPAHEVFRLWLTADGVKRFFAPAAVIEAVPGGRYEMIFFPDDDPGGRSYGTAGARLLALEPGRRLAFEWVVFAGDSLKGAAAPPYASAEIRARRPLPTWVEVAFEPAGSDSATLVRLSHHGFGESPLWREAYAWFERAWAGVLDRLSRQWDGQAGGR
jgi:uncharacterized protein YndB with AHSA1/START domain